MPNPDSNKRAPWKREVVLDRTQPQSPLMLLASFARDKTDKATRAKLCGGTFSETLDELLTTTPTTDLVDLTGDERAFCEGWALLARRQCYDLVADEIDDARLVQWIDEQMTSPPWIETRTG